MADLARIKRNVAKMAAMNAPESDIDGYIASEGVTIDDVRNYQSTPENVLGAVTSFDKGYTGGFGRKLGGVVNAIGAAPVDALLSDKSLGQAFSDRYNEIVDPALKASEKFESANPKSALALNIGGAFASPINKLGAGYIGKGATTLDKLARSAGVGAGAGAAYGAGRTENLDDLATNVYEDAQMGAALGAAAPIAIQGVKGLVAKLRPQNALAGKATGLEAVAKDGDSVKILKRGIQADDAIASQVKEEAPAAMNSLNERMREALNRLTGRKLNIDLANIRQKERYDNFIGKNADKELFSSKSAKQQAKENFNKWFEGSKVVDENGEPLVVYHSTDAVFDAFDKSKQKRGFYGQGFYTSNTADATTHYGKNTMPLYLKMKKPIEGVSSVDLRKNIDKYIQEGYDGTIHRYDDGTITFSVFEPEQLKSVNNSGAWSESASLSDAGWMPKASLDSYTYGLNQFQKDALNQALSKGAYMSTNAKGSLGATHRGQEVLNDMIEASYDTSIIGQKKPTTETRQLMQVKERLNQILEPSGIKPYDAGLSKAKALESAYEKGYKFKPSETKFEALGLEKARDKRAFLQGRIASILDNVKDDKNIAKAIQADENTLRKLMPEGKYKQLLKDANNISTEYERVKNLANQAEKQVVKPEPAGRPMSERTETRGAILGSLMDKINAILMTESNKKAANILLGNEKAIRSKLYDRFMRVPDYSITPYLVDVISQNK
jgi:hypothetical protein